MKQAGYSKRSHGRSTERHKHQQKQGSGDLIDGKIKGNPQQFVEKYLTLARDAASSGDPVSAENYYQYADHYYRITLANRISRMRRTEKKDADKENKSSLVEVTPDSQLISTNSTPTNPQ